MKQDQIILAVDNDGNFKGEYIPKMVGHTGKGKKHLAITVLLENSKGEVLLQRRKHKVFDNIWDITASTHHLHRKDGSDETSKEATLRALKDEYGIDQVEELREVGFIDYFAQYGEYCENEHDIILTSKYDGEIILNPNTAYEYDWVDKKAFLLDIEQNPDKYTPWSIKAAKLLKDKGFF